MSNPNNCKTCDYTKINGNREGHCYMFREAPTEVCMQHTGRTKPLQAFGDALAEAMADMPELRESLISSGAVTPLIEIQQPTHALTDSAILDLAHRTASRYRHNDAWPYQFTAQHILDFARKITAPPVADTVTGGPLDNKKECK